MKNISKFFNDEEYEQIITFYKFSEDFNLLDADSKYTNALADLLVDYHKTDNFDDMLDFLTDSVTQLTDVKNQLAFCYGFRKCMELLGVPEDHFDDSFDVNENLSSDKEQFVLSQDGGILIKYNDNEQNEIVIPDSVKIIAEDAFEDCFHIEKVILPNQIRIIDDNAFKGCDRLREINLPSSLRKIGAYAFYGCAFTELTFPEGLTKIERSAFEETPLTKIALPKTLQSIGSNAFANSALEEIFIDENVNLIGNSAFSHCTNLKKFVISSKETTIEDDVFYGCNNFVLQCHVPSDINDYISSYNNTYNSDLEKRFSVEIKPL